MDEKDERPTFITTIGNTTIKIRSILPFMTAGERKQWFIDNDALPEIQLFKRVWIETNLDIEKQNAEKLLVHEG